MDGVRGIVDEVRAAYLRRLGLDAEPPSADALARLFRRHVERASKHHWLMTSPESPFLTVSIAERRDATGVDVMRGLVKLRIGDRASSETVTHRRQAKRGPHHSSVGNTLAVRVERLGPEDVGLVALIDRSEHVDRQYRVVDGRLVDAPVVMAEIPRWTEEPGEHSIARHIAFCAEVIDAGGVLFGAFDDDVLLGLATVNPQLEPGLAWLATLHVSAAHRRRGAASALWETATQLGRVAGSHSLYVSATPTGSAVGFYLSRGCRLATPVHPQLFAAEPDDVHLVCSI